MKNEQEVIEKAIFAHLAPLSRAVLVDIVEYACYQNECSSEAQAAFMSLLEKFELQESWPKYLTDLSSDVSFRKCNYSDSVLIEEIKLYLMGYAFQRLKHKEVAQTPKSIKKAKTHPIGDVLLTEDSGEEAVHITNPLGGDSYTVCGIALDADFVTGVKRVVKKVTCGDCLLVAAKCQNT